MRDRVPAPIGRGTRFLALDPRLQAPIPRIEHLSRRMEKLTPAVPSPSIVFESARSEVVTLWTDVAWLQGSIHSL